VGAAWEEGKWLDSRYHETDQSGGLTMRWPAKIPDNATGGAEVAPIEVEGGIDSLPDP
jgi:hypothetical protein